MRRFRKLGLTTVVSMLALSAIATTGQPAGAVTPSRVSSVKAVKATGGLKVSGKATFSGEPVNVVGVDPTGDGPPGGTGAATVGSDLSEVHVYQADPAKHEITFEWKVDTLPPPSGAIPEVSLWRWAITIGGTNYVLQAKYSNLLSLATATNAADHAGHIGNAFQIRGNCGTVVAVGNCDDVAWVNGAFDTSNNTVRMILPYPMAEIPELVPGALIGPGDYNGSQIDACVSVFVSNADTCDSATWDKLNAYHVGGYVSVGVAAKGTSSKKIKFTTFLPASPTGTYAGTVKTKLKGSVDVWVKACLGVTCGVAKKITVKL